MKRAATSDPTKGELRCDMDKELLAALDMIALSKGRMARSVLVEAVLRRYVATKQREASLIVKAPAINPPAPDSEWSGL